MQKVVMTGVTSGLGVEWLYELDRSINAEFFIIARNKNKFHKLTSDRPLTNIVHFIECDFASLESINVAVKNIRNITNFIDILINNAGVWSSEKLQRSNDGFEITLAVNHLAPYLLTGKLLPLLHQRTNSRIINTASFRHKDAKVDKSDIQMEGDFNAEQAYCNSKLFTVIFTKKLAKYLGNSNITVNCFDPGIVDTPMLLQGFPKFIKLLYPFVRRVIARTPLKGAETGIFLSNSAKLKNTSGLYFKDSKPKNSSKLSNDITMSDWLWGESERLTKFVYPKHIEHV